MLEGIMSFPAGFPSSALTRDLEILLERCPKHFDQTVLCAFDAVV